MEMYRLTGKSPLICREICKFPDLAGILPPIFGIYPRDFNVYPRVFQFTRGKARFTRQLHRTHQTNDKMSK
jgi:hypothetical protein